MDEEEKIKTKIKEKQKGSPDNVSHRTLPLLGPCLTVFVSSFCIMVLELVASRLIARFLGSSLYTWTAVIGVVLTGITIGNYFGGRIADRFVPRKVTTALFALASVCCVITIIMNNWVGEGWIFLWQLHFPLRVFIHVSLVFLLPSILLGAISPVVAKMALDMGLATGRTVGDIYAWGAAGSIAGTFAAGYYFIAAFGTITILWVLAAVLLVIALVYSFRMALLHVWLLILICVMTMGMAKWEWAQKTGAAIALRKVPDKNTIYENEGQYCYIAVKQIPQAPHIRDFIQDKLMHSRVDMNNLMNLQYFYTRIYAAVTAQHVKNKNNPSFLIIGGGGYVYPRYLKKMWPDSSVDVVEIDPGVTEAAMVAFGLERNTSIRTISMDARNYVDQCIEREQLTGKKTRYDIIYEDAINDYSVPFQLTTREFDEKIFHILNDDGIYMVNLIDIYTEGLFLGSIVSTIEKTFPYVTVMTEAGIPRSHRNTFVIIASKKKLDLDTFYEEQKQRGTIVRHLTDGDVRNLKEKNPCIVLTDDYAPVENLLVPVVMKKSGYDMADLYFREAKELLRKQKFEESVKKYEKIIRVAPSLSIQAYNEMAIVFLEQRKFKEAADALKESLATVEREGVDIYTGSVNYNLGIALSRLGEIEEATEQFYKAIEDFKEQMSIHTQNPQLPFMIAKSYTQMKQYKEAEPYFARVLKLDPSRPSHHLELAGNLEIQHRYDDAISVLKKGIKYLSEHGSNAADLRGYLDYLENKGYLKK